MRAAFQGSPVFLPLVRLWLVALSTGLTPYGFAIKVPTMDRSLLVWGRIIPANQMADITLSLSPANPPQGRALLCTDNNNPGGAIAQPLVAGLQGMTIQYGLSQGLMESMPTGV